MKARWLVSLILILIVSTGMSSSQVAAETKAEPVKNVILLIGDGMGFEHLKLGSYIEYGIEDGLFIQSSEFEMGNVTTYSANDDVTDSAAAATAIATGKKTNDGMISQSPEGQDLQTILEYAQTREMKTGLVSTAYFYHATPAAFAAHQPSRYDYEEIITDMMRSNTDLILGGGFHLSTLPQTVDFDNLLTENNYTQIQTKEELTSLSEGRAIGTMGSGNLQWEADIESNQEVRLHELTNVALDNLDNANGFFLMIEGARIDHAGHENNVTKNALEVIEFDNTVKMVHDWVQDHPDTIVIITSDHETGGLMIDDTSSLGNELPTNDMTEEEKRQLRVTRTSEVEVSYSTTGHTGQNVPIMGFGKGFDDLRSRYQVIDNTDIYDMMRLAIDGELLIKQKPLGSNNDIPLMVGLTIVLIPILYRRYQSNHN